MPDFDAVVLAGGRGRRLGGIDKPALRVGSETLLDRVLAAVAGARRRVVVGPARELAPGVLGCREQPPGGGPVAALAAGLAHTTAELVVVLAADLPDIAPAVPELLAALSTDAAQAAVLVDPDGRLNYLAAAWRRSGLLRAVADVSARSGPAGVPARRLLEVIGRSAVVQVPDPAGWGLDCDSWDDVRRARRPRPEPGTPDRSTA